jgi:hypothetical protein
MAVNSLEAAVRLDGRTTLPGTGVRALSTQAVLLTLSAAVLPALSHLAGLPVRWILPMHWAVLLAGLTYGWRAGAIIGLLAPGASFLLSGMPFPHILPAMTVELGTYGFVAGFARQSCRLGGVPSTLAAIIAGRAVFVAAALATGAAGPTIPAYLQAALLPGLLAALAQVFLLPAAAAWWIGRESRR